MLTLAAVHNEGCNILTGLSETGDKGYINTKKLKALCCNGFRELAKATNSYGSPNKPAITAMYPHGGAIPKCEEGELVPVRSDGEQVFTDDEIILTLHDGDDGQIFKMASW